VTGIGDRFAALHAARTAPLRAADLEPLRGPVLDCLRAAPAFVGCGVVVAPGLLADAERHLEWWERGAGGVPVRLVLDLDPAGEDSYDYPAMAWFVVPRAEGRRAVQGPYVDFRGANRYVFTFAVPVTDGAAFLGIAGADVGVHDLEPALLAALDGLPGPAVVVAPDRRVVVANSGRWTVGARLRSFPDVDGGEFAEVHLVDDDLGWVLALAAP
jgi:hypothetical protein